MSFRDLDLKISYRSKSNDNVADDFLVPALKMTKLYKRSAGYFSSSVFDLLKAGIEDFVERDAEIRLICSPELNDDDIDAINCGYTLKNQCQQDKLDKDVEECLAKIENNTNLNLLINLIKNGKFNIIIAETLDNEGIYHDKIGILKDEDDNKILFVGSSNESKGGYSTNYEKIRLSKSWISGDLERIADDEEEFDSIWDGSNKYIRRVDCNNNIIGKIQNELTKREYTPRSYTERVKEDVEDFNSEKDLDKYSELEGKLFDYQKEAVEKWEENNNKGFFVMATGTGKTWTAIYAALKKMREEEDFFLVICAPYIHLIKQWSYDIEQFCPNAEIVLVYGGNDKWYDQLSEYSHETAAFKNKRIIAISTIDSFLTNKFERVMERNKSKKMLIVDEAHNYNKDRKDVIEKFDYTIGLSATPTNDPRKDDGSELMDLFGGKVYDLPIEFAIEQNKLVKYNYYPLFVDATPEEEKRFKKKSLEIASCYKDNICIDTKRAWNAYLARLRVIAMADEKQKKIQDFISKIPEKDHFIVYCGDGKVIQGEEQIKHVTSVLHELSIADVKASKFTASESMKERMDLIEAFNNGTIDALAAIKCLDEGVNIPSIKSALILASADNYRQTVQRRGRILRHYTDKYTREKKTIANIFDVIVLPSAESKKFATIEIKRMFEYLRLAENKDDYWNDFSDLCLDYGITEDDLYNNDESLEEEMDE